MKIISKHWGQDVYDHAGLGVDETIVFDRDAQNGFATFPFQLDVPETARIRQKNMHITVQPALVLVGGQAHKVAQSSFKPDDFDCTEIQTHVTRDDLQAWLKPFLSKDQVDKPKRRQITHVFMPKTKHILTWMDGDTLDLTDICAQHKIIAGILKPNTKAYWTNSTEPTWTFEPRLMKDLGMTKILEPHDMHMMISRFVGGVLTQPDPPEPVPNDVKIKKHGFDTKTSFRKRKQT